MHSKFKFFFVSILLHLFIVPLSFGQTKAEKIDEVMRLYHEYGQFNGSVLVAEKGNVIYKKGHGLANMEWEIPNQPDTKHRIGSISKQFTSMLILQLVEAGMLKLDTPITTYLPDYPKENGNKITIHHLLTHSSGIPNYTSFPKFFKYMSRNPYTPEEFVTVFKDSTLQFQPGEKYKYSNSGYFLLGVLIEKVTGKSYEQVLKDKILVPLKMNNTGYDHHSDILKNRASGYEKEGRGYRNTNYLDMSIPYAAGSLYATVEDLYLWDQALHINKLLSKEYMDLIFKPHIATNDGHYGYGWGIEKSALGKLAKDSTTVVEHGGGINGFNSLISRIPADKNLVVLLNNTSRTALYEMENKIRKILYDKPYEFPKKSIAHALLIDIEEVDMFTALERLDANRKSDIYIFKEGEMNGIGYQLLRSGKVEEAIEVFKLNVTEFPESWNVYDSLGEAYMNHGNKKMAIKNYKKSITLNPKNEGGIKMLEQLKINKH